MKHIVNGDQQNGWYCYQCKFFSRDVVVAAEHDGMDDSKFGLPAGHERDHLQFDPESGEPGGRGK